MRLVRRALGGGEALGQKGLTPLGKRVSSFLGKRIVPLLGKRFAPFWAKGLYPFGQRVHTPLGKEFVPFWASSSDKKPLKKSGFVRFCRTFAWHNARRSPDAGQWAGADILNKKDI